MTVGRAADHHLGLPRARILLIDHRGSVAPSRCVRCQERTAHWRSRGSDGEDRPVCVYCASLEAGTG